MSGAILILKNRRESLRLSLDEFRGRNLVSCRIWFRPDDGGELRPGRDGWALAVDKLPELIAGLQQLEAEARERGLLPLAQKGEPRPIGDLVSEWVDGGAHEQ